MTVKNLKIVFLGTPGIAVPSLEILLKNNYNVVGVVTAPDKPSGRGLQLASSAVKQIALQHRLKVFQPENLKDKIFLNEIKSLAPDLMVVVAFRMMPQELWQLPPMGTFNLHASLLPHYRGAAPINRAIMNGEKETGVTTFFLKHQVDTGNILFSEKVLIDENETAGELHDRLMITGAQLVLKTVNAIEKGMAKEIPQSTLITENEFLKTAPKIFKEDCRIDWNKTMAEIHNHIRGLSPYPAAFAQLISPEGEIISVKIYKSRTDFSLEKSKPGTVFTDSKTFLKISCADGWIKILEMQLPGKKKFPVEEVLRGFGITGEWKVV